MDDAKPSEEKEIYWTKIIQEARDYSDGVAGYCRDHDISKDTYYAWFKKLRFKHPEWKDLKAIPQARRISASGQPKTGVSAKAQRRTFSAAYKAKILAEIDSAPSGQMASILRREGLYSSHIQKWRSERDERALAPKKRGPKPNPLLRENKQLKKELARLQKQLEQANDIIEVQKKISRILGVTLETTNEDE